MQQLKHGIHLEHIMKTVQRDPGSLFKSKPVLSRVGTRVSQEIIKICDLAFLSVCIFQAIIYNAGCKLQFANAWMHTVRQQAANLDWTTDSKDDCKLFLLWMAQLFQSSALQNLEAGSFSQQWKTIQQVVAWSSQDEKDHIFCYLSRLSTHTEL